MNKVHSIVGFSTVVELRAHLLDLKDDSKVLCCGDNNIYLIEFEDGTIMFENSDEVIEELKEEMLGDDCEE